MDIIRLPDQLGPKLRAARVQLGWTQADVASQLGISTQAVSKLENNAGRASFDRVHRLCLLLGLELGLQAKSASGSKSANPSKATW
ncbi:MAG TPA: helix-turn-helix transcriptional regulator [Dokdonella sp.]|uniref:helix-turn-helix domain-containing protein n=1 Tax=Dokdonella sp. TaxID=2291710 RepID=UPI002D810276|nr:helix-turn-helix transcriptional regulator [Dokdonella sp.]HET9033889.1 helix-turn-helix transcriptional regulator [Dokdonella sp.]